MSNGQQVEDVKSVATAKSSPEHESHQSRDQPSCNDSSTYSSKEDLLRSRYRKTVAKLQHRTGIVTIIVLIIIIWGLLVCRIVSYRISRIIGSNSENQTQNSSLLCLQTECNISGTYSTSLESDGNLSSVMSSGNLTGSITCSHNFYLDEETSQCKPECGEWGLYSAKAEATVSALTVVSSAIGTIGGIVVLVVSCINHKHAFTFPSALVRYQTATFMVLNVLLLIGRINPKKLFCNSRNLLESVEDPTPFCSLIGFASLVSYWQASWWWLIHIAVIFWGLRYPFHAHKFESTSTLKYLHITAVLLVFIVPCIPVGVVLGTGGHTFRRYPPFLCSPHNEDASFFLDLPLGVLVAVGTSLLTNVLWTVCKRSQTTADSSTDLKLWTVEVKILIVLCYFLGTGIIIFIANIVGYWQTIGMQEFNTYFICEGVGSISNSSCDRSAINSTIPAQVLLDISQIILGLFPAVNLVYVVSFQQIKKKCRLQQTSRSMQTGITNDY